MLNIKKKIIAIAVICAMAVSMSACSDKKDGTADTGIKTATLSSEEAEQLKEVDLEISEFIPPSDAAQDPVEQSGDSSSQSGGSDEQSNADPNGESNIDQSSFDAEQAMSSTDMVIVPGNDGADSSSNSDGGNSTGGDSNNSAGNNNSNSDGNNSNSDNNNSSNSDAVIQGEKKIQQAFWMNLSGDYVFDGEFITATFKIKETTADGTYPITVDWLDFSNISAVSVKASGINGSVVVGGDATANTFKNDGSFEVMADNVSGKAGDTVTVSIRFNKNPGICASVLRFGYDSDALEYVSGGKGADFVNALKTQNLDG